MLTFTLSAAAILIGVFWFVMTRLTGPLRRLVGAADRLGRGEDVADLPMVGPPAEVRDLTSTFNRMQDRLTRFVADRTRLLAALGHDLRSPLTALRVRAEMVDDDETRDSLVASVEEMQSMVEATLTFARGLAGSEEPETVEIGAFLDALRSDMVTPFHLDSGPSMEVRIRPHALRRALRNVIENAERYGGDNPRVCYQARNDEFVITVEDNGPGIPPAPELERVFDPFFRLEQSRSLETGGHGLGLSIARTIIRAHGGDISLSNRDEGGGCVLRSLSLLRAHSCRKETDMTLKFTTTALATSLASSAAYADSVDGWDRGFGHMAWGGGGFGMFGGLMMLIFWGGVILALIVMAVRWFTSGRPPGGTQSTDATDILKSRFASGGEIDEDEFRKRKAALED